MQPSPSARCGSSRPPVTLLVALALVLLGLDSAAAGSLRVDEDGVYDGVYDFVYKSGEKALGLPRAVPPTERFMVTGTYNNLKDQRLSLLRSMVKAKELGLTFVLPSWQLEYTDYPPYGTSEVVPFTYFYSAEVLSRFAVNLGLAIARELPSHLVPGCLSQLGHSYSHTYSVRVRPMDGAREVMDYDYACPSVGNLTSALLEFANSYGVACVSAKCSYHLQRPGLDDAKLAPFRPALQPSEMFAAELEAIFAELRRRYNSDEYAAVHARTEAGWAVQCPHAEQQHGGYSHECYVSEANITQYMEALLPAGSVVFVASSDPIASMTKLCETYRCWRRETVKPFLGPGIINKPSSRAFLDLILASRGKVFFGNRYSAFSEEVAEEYRARAEGERVHFYNPPKPEGSGPQGNSSSAGGGGQGRRQRLLLAAQSAAALEGSRSEWA